MTAVGRRLLEPFLEQSEGIWIWTCIGRLHMAADGAATQNNREVTCSDLLRSAQRLSHAQAQPQPKLRPFTTWWTSSRVGPGALVLPLVRGLRAELEWHVHRSSST